METYDHRLAINKSWGMEMSLRLNGNTNSEFRSSNGIILVLILIPIVLWWMSSRIILRLLFGGAYLHTPLSYFTIISFFSAAAEFRIVIQFTRIQIDPHFNCIQFNCHAGVLFCQPFFSCTSGIPNFESQCCLSLAATYTEPLIVVLVEACLQYSINWSG